MATFAQLFESTKKLFDHLEKPLPQEDREEYLAELDQLLQTRQQLIETYKGKLTEVERDQAKIIVALNKRISEKLQSYMSQIKLDMSKLKQQKQTGLKYENPYDTQTDGFFIDKKN